MDQKSLMKLRERLPSLDLLRTIAILMTIASHYPRAQGVSFFGWIGTHSAGRGVDLFFVLSGYLIAKDIFIEFKYRTNFHLWTFYVRRALRTFPNYFFMVAIYLIFPALNEFSGSIETWHFLTFTQNFSINAFYLPFSQSWSLCVEEHFYLILPLLLIFFHRYLSINRMILIVSSLIIVGILLRAFVWYKYIVIHPEDMLLPFFLKIYYPTWSRLDGLALGVLIAYFSIKEPSLWIRLSGKGNLFFGIGLCLALWAMQMQSVRYELLHTAIGFPIVSFGFAFILLAALDSHSWLNRFQFPGAKFFAEISYALYVVHLAAIIFITKFLNVNNIPTQSWSAVSITISMTIIIATLLYYGVERPFLNLRRLYFPKKI